MKAERTEQPYQQWQAYFARGGSLRTLRRLATSDLDKIYHYGYQLYQRGQLREAKNFFYLLVSVDQWRFDYQLALGLCYQSLGEHQQAVDTFSQAALIRMDDPRPPYCSACSYYQLGEVENAKKAYQAALKWCIAHPEMPELKQAAENGLAAITLRSVS